jgi:chemotaxis protein CheX
MLDLTAPGGKPVDPEIRQQLLEPFIEAARAALAEMATTEVVAEEVGRMQLSRPLGDLAAFLPLQFASEGLMVLNFPQQTAAALAGRMLAGITETVDEGLIRDCLGEIANVVAGQAKTLLAGTAYQFTFDVPRVVAGTSHVGAGSGREWLVVAFGSDQGPFSLGLQAPADF